MSRAIYDGQPPGFTRGAYYGRRQVGELAEAVPIAAPGAYFAPWLSLPADTGKRVRAAVTRWPTLGTFLPAESGSYSYTGEADYALWQWYVDGVASTANLQGLGPGVGRTDFGPAQVRLSAPPLGRRLSTRLRGIAASRSVR